MPVVAQPPLVDLHPLTVGALAPAPVASDNTTVILWVVAVLVVVVLALARLFLSQIRSERAERIAQANDCRAENQKAWAKVEERDREITALVRDGQRLQGDTVHALGRVADAVSKLEHIVRDSQRERG
jgi:uncharacterized protein HemX